MKPPLLISCDFDGTITRQDTLVEILNTYGSDHWHDIQKKVVAGTLSIREGLQAEMGSVQADETALKELLQRRVELDPSFSPFLKTVRAQGIPLVLLSGGFDLCLETVLAKEGLSYIPYLANHLHRKDGSWKVEFPYPSVTCQDCGHCKGDPVSAWKSQGYTTVFVGNGVTDRCAVLAADLTFTKDELQTWCRSQGIPSVPYRTFTDVQHALEDRGWL